MTEAAADDPLDEYLPAAMRHDLEERLWRPIEARASLEVLRADAGFLQDPASHPAIFADHGVVHVRDIASGFLNLAATVNGLLLPRRPADRQRFLVSCGVLLAYLHDIGMVDMTPEGRRIHAIYAAHAAFGSTVDGVVAHTLEPGPVRARLDEVERSAPFAAPLDMIVREMLSLAMAHSKSTVPPTALDDRVSLRARMQAAVFTPLDERRRQPRGTSPAGSWDARTMVNHHGYADPASSFAWLVSHNVAQRAFADDVIDAVRVLRAADALRQRGTGLRTSGGFEVCMDAATGQAVYTLRSDDGGLSYLLSFFDQKGAGEANIRVAAVTPWGHLRVAFHRGAYLTDEAARRAAASTAHVVEDIGADVLPAFDSQTWTEGLPPPTLRADQMRIQLEYPGDNSAFAEEVAALLVTADPTLSGRVVCVADLEAAAPVERERFLRGVAIEPDGDEARDIVSRMAACGSKVDGIDLAAAFSEVSRAVVEPGELLVTAGSAPTFVYVATDSGLIVRPLGGYAAKAVHPWTPIGTTGVIRRSGRNADIVADRRVEVIVIPGELFTRSWLRTYSPQELSVALTGDGRPVDLGERTS